MQKRYFSKNATVSWPGPGRGARNAMSKLERRKKSYWIKGKSSKFKNLVINRFLTTSLNEANFIRKS